MFSEIKPLTQEQRQTAQDNAQNAVMRAVGDRPLRENFDRHTASRYPPSVTKLINILCIVLLLAAFTPSAIRSDFLHCYCSCYVDPYFDIN